MYAVDASVWVNGFDQREAGHATSRHLLEVLRMRALPIIVPNLVFAEVAGAISRTRNHPVRVEAFATTLGRLPNVTVVALDEALGYQARALAMELIEEAIGHKVPFGMVVFDAWYLAEDLVQVLARRRKDWISLLKKNRLLETTSFHLRDTNGWTMKLPGPYMAIEELVPLIPANAYRSGAVSEQTYWCFTLAVRIPGLGKVRIVVSFEHEPVTGRYTVLVTNRADWSVAKIIAVYLQRWPTETFYQDRKGWLGFNAYRMRSAEAIGKHWCLVFVVYSLLHLTCMPARPERTRRLIQTIEDACRQQGRALLQQLLVFVHDQLSQSGTVDQVFARLFARQRGMVPA